jgi:hypothetical protein
MYDISHLRVNYPCLCWTSRQYACMWYMRLAFWVAQIGYVKALCYQNQIICGSEVAQSVQWLGCPLDDLGISVRFIMAVAVFMVRLFLVSSWRNSFNTSQYKLWREVKETCARRMYIEITQAVFHLVKSFCSAAQCASEVARCTAVATDRILLCKPVFICLGTLFSTVYGRGLAARYRALQFLQYRISIWKSTYNVMVH